MAHRLIFDDKVDALLAGQLASPRLLGIKMVEAGLAGDYFSIFSDFQSLAK
jgi:hypothetical protein